MPFALPTILATPYTDYAARVSVVEGYSSNTYQTEEAIPGNPNFLRLVRHPSPLTEVDGQLEARLHASVDELHTFRIGARVVHYEPLTPQYQTDDGSVNATYSGRITLSPRTFLTLSADGAFATQNAAHIADATFFSFDPTTLLRTYWLSGSEIGITHELSQTWRVRQAVGVIMSGTVDQPAELLPGGQTIKHRGLDFVQPLATTDFIKDMSERTTLDLSVMLLYSYNFYVLDLSRNPPQDIGPTKFASARVMFGHMYRFTQEITNSISAGGVLAQAPPDDPDQRPIIAPAAIEMFTYAHEFWGLMITAGLTYGSVNPRLGAGLTENAGLTLTGTPYRIGNWRNLSFLINGQASNAALASGVGQSTRMGLIAADVEARYALNPWLGLHGGYRIRYATLDTPNQVTPAFLQHTVFFGLSAYWSTDKTQPPLMNFAPQLR